MYFGIPQLLKKNVDSSKARPNNIIRVGNQLKSVRLCLYNFINDPKSKFNKCNLLAL